MLGAIPAKQLPRVNDDGICEDILNDTSLAALMRASMHDPLSVTHQIRNAGMLGEETAAMCRRESQLGIVATNGNVFWVQ